MRKRLSPGVILGIVAVVFAGTSSATAGVLITSGKIKDGTIQGRDIKKGTITSDKLAGSVRTQLLKAGTPGPAGAKGDTGVKGDTGAAGGTTTVQGSAPQKGDTGTAGKDGLNGSDPATLVATSGDSGWTLAGGGGTTGYPQASLTGGQLHLQGGFDASTTAGAIGIAKAYDNAPIGTLKALSYDFRISKRPSSNVSAPTIHVAVLKAATGTASGFTNFVFEPYMQTSTTFGLNQTYSVDTLAGTWWATRSAGGIDQAHPASWADVIAKNPDATISAISVDNGGTSGPGTVPGPDFAADADNVIVGFGSTFTRFDFGG